MVYFSYSYVIVIVLLINWGCSDDSLINNPPNSQNKVEESNDRLLDGPKNIPVANPDLPPPLTNPVPGAVGPFSPLFPVPPVFYRPIVELPFTSGVHRDRKDEDDRDERLCQDSDAPSCEGSCPENQVCNSQRGHCRCEPIFPDCGDAEAPTCNGFCEEDGAICRPLDSNCQCQVPCNQAEPESCGGFCDIVGEECLPNQANTRCECRLPVSTCDQSQPDSCGGTCAIIGEECFPNLINNNCECRLPTCEETEPDTCGGTCTGVGEECLPNVINNNCECRLPTPTCEETEPDTCGGTCANEGEACQIAPDGFSCECALPCPACGSPFPNFSYSDFSSVSGLNLVGDAFQDVNVIRLVNEFDMGLAGAVWYVENKQCVLGGFDTSFDFQFTGGETRADGFAFVVQNDSPNAVGGNGSSMGYVGIDNSLAVIFDIFVDLTDDSAIRIQLGALTLAEEIIEAPPPNFAYDNLSHTGRIVYTDTNPPTIDVYVDTVLILSYQNASIDLTTILSSRSAWLGFTGATGGFTVNADLQSWDFAVTPCPL